MTKMKQAIKVAMLCNNKRQKQTSYGRDKNWDQKAKKEITTTKAKKPKRKKNSSKEIEYFRLTYQKEKQTNVS